MIGIYWNDDWTGLAIFTALCLALSHAIDWLQNLEAKSLSFSETSMDGISLMTFVPRFHGTQTARDGSDLRSDCLKGSGCCLPKVKKLRDYLVDKYENLEVLQCFQCRNGLDMFG